MALERRILEPAPQRAVDAGDGQSIAPGCSPRLPRAVGQQPGDGARGDAVVHAHAGPVVEEEIAVVHARIEHELAHYTRALGKAAVRAAEFAEQPQEKL